jgi:ribonuclease G
LILSIKPKNFGVIVRTSSEDKRVMELDTELKTLVKRWEDNMAKILKNKAPSLIYEETGRTVAFKNGAYLIIEHTEAMHVVDVNSKNRSKSSSGQENTAFDVNLAAADEIARQLRFRDMGGIIVVDYIDMHESDNRQKLFDHMRQIMANDRARHNILPLSKFGLMQITRQRVRSALDFTTAETCPVCFGKGEIKPSILFMDVLEGKIRDVVQKLKVKKFKLYVHPYIAAFINQGIFPLKMKWKPAYSWGMQIIPDQSLGFLEYKFFDRNKNELDMKDESLSA